MILGPTKPSTQGGGGQSENSQFGEGSACPTTPIQVGTHLESHSPQQTQKVHIELMQYDISQ